LFFHPFEDGNARAAMLALAFVLARDGVSLDEAHPLQVTRWADDADGAAELAVLLGILITATQRRLFKASPSCWDAMSDSHLNWRSATGGRRWPDSCGNG
jgi:hypothetical protein